MFAALWIKSESFEVDMTRGTLSTVVSPRSDLVRASGWLMVVTLHRSCSSEVSR